MTPAAYEQALRLVHPMPLETRGTLVAWFKGTVEQAQQCELLRDVGVPGEPGQPKCSRTLTLPDGRKVSVFRTGRSLVRVYFRSTEAERQARDEADDRRREDAKALKAAAAADKVAQEALQKLKEQPATEAEFRKLAKEAFWRQWSVFRLAFLGDCQRHASGFRFTAATVDMLHAFAHSIAWALEADGTVILDEDHRNAQVRKAQELACKLDHPLQRFIEQVKASPLEQEGGT